ncbi:MAG: FAD-dependent monooxygenase [Clostridiales bacterium]|nr:FAD-dependent monooxygenase [Clostridiales bacterium]
MSKNIIIAGAGHGGIVCGALLAEQGYKVDIYEAKKRRDIGHDWTDSFDIKSFEDAGIPMPPEDKLGSSHNVTYTNPNYSVFIKMPDSASSKNVIIDRKYLIKYLISYAEKCGVKFHFDCEITAPIADRTRILGFLIKKNGKTSAVFGDLVIDSAGVDSPVRTLLPERFNILKEFDGTQMFTCYRAFFKRNPGEPEPEHNHLVDFYHMREPGIDWVITDEKYMDILIGRFGDVNLTQGQIDSTLNDLREKFPAIGTIIIRGGTVTKIPIRRTIPIMVADGYAAIGDCAAMTIPIIGSGIANSIRAGKYLADAVLADVSDEFTAATLWRYQYDYFMNIGNKLVIVDKLRTLATSLQASDVDYLLEKEILSANEIALSTGHTASMSMTAILHKLLKSLPKLPVLANAAKTFANVGSLKKTLNAMPEVYDKEEVMQWTKKYEEL